MDNEKPKWSLIGVSEKGTSHEKSGKPCQDAYAFQMINSNWSCLAVADGLGSRSRSDVGARIAVEAAIFAMRECLLSYPSGKPWSGEVWEIKMRTVLKQCYEKIEAEANHQEVELKEYSCTIVLITLGQNETIGISIGDSASVVENLNSDITTFTRPMCGEYINQTAGTLLSKGAIKRAQYVYQGEGVKSVAAFTDGLQLLTLKFPSWDPHIPFFRQTFDYFGQQETDELATSQLRQWIQSDHVRGKTDDDVTLVIGTKGNCINRDLDQTATDPIKELSKTADSENLKEKEIDTGNIESRNAEVVKEVARELTELNTIQPDSVGAIRATEEMKSREAELRAAILLCEEARFRYEQAVVLMENTRAELLSRSTRPSYGGLFYLFRRKAIIQKK